MDTMARLAETILSEDGILALVLIVVLLILAGVVYALLQLIRQQSADGALASAQAQVIGQLVSTMREISEGLEKVAATNAVITANLVKVAELANAHDERVATMQIALDGAIGTMQETSAARDDQIAQIPGKVRTEMAPDFERLPKAIEEALAPKIETLQADIEALITKLDTKLSDRIEKVSDDIPIRTTELLREDLAQLRTIIDTRLRDMLKTATIVAAEPGEGEAPDPGTPKPDNTTSETTSETSEETTDDGN